MKTEPALSHTGLIRQSVAKKATSRAVTRLGIADEEGLEALQLLQCSDALICAQQGSLAGLRGAMCSDVQVGEAGQALCYEPKGVI